MYIEIQEMQTVIADYKLDEITDSSSEIIQSCILAAIKRVRSYLGKYDTTKIFTATGDDRDPDIVEIVKNVALWNLIRRNNVDILYARVKDIYDRDIAYLKEISNGNISADLPLVSVDGVAVSSMRSGSNEKFTHSW